MAADLISVLVNFEDEGLPFLVHAIFSLLPYSLALYTGTLLNFCGAALTAESSTLFLNLRLLAISTGRTKNSVYEANQAMFFLTFLFVRIFVCFAFLTPHFFTTLLGLMEVQGGGYTIKRLEGASEVPVFFWGVMTAVFLVMNTLNSFWAFGMVKIALGVGSKKKKKEDSKKKKKKEESVTTRKLTFVNWFGYGPVLALFPEDEKSD
jgi:hypothetical protein